MVWVKYGSERRSDRNQYGRYHTPGMTSILPSEIRAPTSDHFTG